MLEPGTLLNGRYRIVHTIGQGGMGVVYKALDTRLQATVALKQTLVSAAGGRAFEQEARLLATLRHPALPVVSDYFSEGAAQCLVMQFIPGDDLASKLAQRHSPFTLAEVVGWAEELLDALSYLHRQAPAIVHRDIKPQNLKLAEDDRIILLDFGLAKGRGGLSVGAAPASVFGYTPQYAPLEQIQGTGTSPASDLYSLAATLYHLLCGAPPPDALSRAAALVGRRVDPLAPLEAMVPEAPRDLSAMLQRMLGLNLQDRPASAAELREQFRSIKRQLGPSARAGADPSAPTQVPRAQPARAPELAAESASGVEDEVDTPTTPDVLIYAAGEEAAAAIELERRKMAELLQIQVVDPLSLLLAQANIYDQLLAGIPTARTAISVLNTLARQAMQQARDLSDGLRPAVLDELGLEPALDVLAGLVRRSYGLRVSLELERQRDRAPHKIELALFRAAQDAVERVIQTARASMIHIAFTRAGERLTLSVGDDGAPDAGIELLEPARRRIHQIGGSFELGSSPQGGLLLTIGVRLLQFPELTAREREVLSLVARGQSNKAIAQALQIAPRTVGFHLDNIYAKLGVRSRTEAAIYALRYL